MFPTDVAKQYYEAQRLFSVGKAAQALAILDTIDQQAPNHPEVMHARALCLHATGNLKEALKQCNLLYTMHRDRRGLELRNKWTNPRWSVDTAVNTEASTVAAPVQTETVVATVQRAPSPPLDAAFLQHAALVCLGFTAEERPVPAAHDEAVPARLRAMGCTAEEYNAGLSWQYDVCLPNATSLIAHARAAGVPIIVLPSGFACADGSDLSPYVYLRMTEDHGADPRRGPGRTGGEGAGPAPELCVEDEDRVLLMTGDDAFTSTNLRFVLRNLEIQHLVIFGGPVETAISRTVSTAHQRSFQQVLVEDAVYGFRDSTRTACIEDLKVDHIASAEDVTGLLAVVAGQRG